jgi:hypothetical protein
MKIEKRLSVVVATLVLAIQFNADAFASAPTVQQANMISTYLDASDFESLAFFLKSHPELMEGSDPLAFALLRFMGFYARGTAFAFSPSTLAEIEAALSQEKFAAVDSPDNSASIY